MHAKVFAAFETICRRRFTGGRVLEVGAMSSPDTLLRLPSLAAATERVGINMLRQPALDGAVMIEANAHDMTMFAAGRFDAVVCNSVLEHDPRFWRSLAEMRRMTRPGGLMVIGVPGYEDPPPGRGRRLLLALRRLVPARGALSQRIEARLASTPTLLIHEFPGDFYRFSRQAMAQVLLEGLVEVEVMRVMVPPRLIGSGRMPSP